MLLDEVRRRLQPGVYSVESLAAAIGDGAADVLGEAIATGYLRVLPVAPVDSDGDPYPDQLVVIERGEAEGTVLLPALPSDPSVWLP